MHALRHSALLLVALLLCACASLSPPATPQRTLVLVSIDGLRADVIGTGMMPTLDRIASEGVHADWMNPSYPSLTFPNHYTLVTGLRPDHHGIVNNTMRDPSLGAFVSKQASGRDGRWWSGAEPLWVTLQAHGGIAATMFWPGSEAEIHGVRPHDWLAFDAGMPPDARVDTLLGWLQRPLRTRPQLITLYFDQVDHASHDAGPFSTAANDARRAVDAALARLLSGLQAQGLRDRVDVVIVSDHGMAELPPGHTEFLDDRVPADAIDVVTTGQVVGLSARPGHEAQVAAAVLGRHAHDTCWRKDDLPPQWHYGHNPRVPAIVCQADDGWDLTTHALGKTRTTTGGEHGFAPELKDMRAVFVASGPDFARGARIAAFDNVDLYPLLAALLGIPAQPNDGDIGPLLPTLNAQGRERIGAAPARSNARQADKMAIAPR